MILEKIRTTFPESIRTQEQDLLIGSSCLALTDQERDTIENLNFNRYESSLDREKRKDLSLRVAKSVADSQWWGEVSGFVTGGVSAGAGAWYLAAFTPFWTALSGLAGGYLGSKAGKQMGGDIGHEMAITNESNTPEFVHWRNKKYATVILPALSRYVDPDKESKTCPITLDWMVEPVRADDGHVYEKEALIEHLITWRERAFETLVLRGIQGGSPLSPEEERELLSTRSPFRNGNITIAGLEELPGYYDETIKSLTAKYNMEVLKQHAIVDQSKNQTQELSKEVAKVVRFYSMTQEERNHIKTDMRRDLLGHRVFRLDKEEDEALEFLKAAAKPPELIKYTV